MAKFNGNEGEKIDVGVASTMTSEYRKANGSNATKAFYIGGRIVLRILGQENCVGIRMYNALDEEGKPQMVLVGVDENGNDMHTGIVADKCSRCPDDCDENGSPLK